MYVETSTYTKRQVLIKKCASSIYMFITAVCFLFLIKLRWPKNKSIYDDIVVFLNMIGGISVIISDH